MNYEEMSDLVIDRKVFVQMYGECIGDKDMHRVWQDNKFRPCNSPSDAWPIMNDARIEIKRDTCQAHVSSYFNPEFVMRCRNDEKLILRAAMICFLKMKEVCFD